MNRIWLIARREYLSYVATWGFWISLAMVPVFMTVGFGLPVLLQQSSPQRVFAVVADEPRLVEAIDEELEAQRQQEVGGTLAGIAATEGGPDAAVAVGEALAEGASPEQAAREAGLAEDAVRRAEERTRRAYVRVDAPAQTEDAMRPYLTGERPLPGADRPGPLHAAVFVRRGDDGRYEVDYWSANLTDGALRAVAARAVGRVMRDDALRDAGIDPASVREVENLRPVVRDLSPEKEEGAEEVELADRLPFILGIGAGFVLWSVIFSVANMLLTSTIEEKSNRVLEVLLSSARLPEILSGKLMGVAGVSFTLLGVWLGAGLMVLVFISTSSAIPSGPAADILAGVMRPGLLIPFLFYFVVGYLIFGAVFMAIGSLCETIQEAQTLMSPMILILMAPMILLSFTISNPDSPLLAGAAWFPLFTPFLMIARLPHDPPLWVVAGTSALMVATVIGVIWGASTVFRAGALGQAKPGSFGSILKAFKRA